MGYLHHDVMGPPLTARPVSGQKGGAGDRLTQASGPPGLGRSPFRGGRFKSAQGFSGVC